MNKPPLKIIFYTFCKNEISFVDRWAETVENADLVVVIDTGSTDGTYEKFLEIASTHKNFIITQRIYDFFRFDVAFNDARNFLGNFHNPACCNCYAFLELDQTFANGDVCEAARKAYQEAEPPFSWFTMTIKEELTDEKDNPYTNNRGIGTFGGPKPPLVKYAVHEEGIKNYLIFSAKKATDFFSTVPSPFVEKGKDLSLGNTYLLHTPTVSSKKPRNNFYQKLLKLRYDESMDPEITISPYDTFSALAYFIFFNILEHRNSTTALEDKATLKDSFLEIQKALEIKGEDYFQKFAGALYFMQFYFVVLLNTIDHKYKNMLHVLYEKVLSRASDFEISKGYPTTFGIWEEPLFQRNGSVPESLQDILPLLRNAKEVEQFIPAFKEFGRNYLSSL